MVDWLVTALLFAPYVVFPVLFVAARWREWQADVDYRHAARTTQRAIAAEAMFGGTLYKNPSEFGGERYTWVSDDEPLSDDFLA